MEITFTIDVEDHSAGPGDLPRHVTATRNVLEFLAERDTRGTFFVVGDVGVRAPDLVREIAAAGHEVGAHGARHAPLTDWTPEDFARELKDAKHRLEDLAQDDVTGFRAPMFSLVRETTWALPVLADLGFAYSSSIMPIHHPLFGHTGCPFRPFRWPNGLVELPCPVVRVGRYGLPWLGAVWLRNLPWPLVRAGLRMTERDGLLWTYAHPYDFDPDEPFRVLSEAGRIGSWLIWRHRSKMFDDLDRLLGTRHSLPLRERIGALPAPLPTVAAAGG